METHEEWEHYSDSDGKSGGQKEKLAYTILAASLAYQFGLEWGAVKSKDFRFAVIDEAFGRGSDASTRYALELFAKLGLQLLDRHPAAEDPRHRALRQRDRIRRQPDRHLSRLQTMTIEEYREPVGTDGDQPMSQGGPRRRHRRQGPTAMGRRHAPARLAERTCRSTSIDIPLRGPKASEIGDDLDAVRDWIAVSTPAVATTAATPWTWQPSEGATSVATRSRPRAVVSTFDQAWALLGVADEVRRFDRVLALAAGSPAVRTGWSRTRIGR